MRIYWLLKDLQQELKLAFEKFPFRDGEDFRPPEIWIGDVPPKISLPTNVQKPYKSGEPPFIVIRFLDGDQQIDKAKFFEIRIGFLCAVYSKESFDEIETGYQDIFNMIERVMLVLNNRHYWLESFWKCEENIKVVSGLQKELTNIYDAGSNSHPFYGSAVVATFTCPAINRPPFPETDNKY